MTKLIREDDAMLLVTKKQSYNYCCSMNSTSMAFYVCYFIGNFKYLLSDHHDPLSKQEI